MKAILLYNRNTPDERLVAEYGARLEKAQVEIELLDADSPAGIQLAESHDVMGRPALVLVREDGSPVQIWQGQGSLPPVSEVAYQAHQ